MNSDSLTLIALVVVASGYIIYDAPVCRLFWPIKAGYVLYLRTIVAGLILLCLLYPLYQFTFSHESLFPLFIFAVAILIRAVVSALEWCVYQFTTKWRNELNLKKFEPGSFNRFVYTSMREENLVQITLENNKVYIGFPFKVDLNENDKWLHLIPWYSGHRDKKRKMHINIDYFKTFLDIDSKYESVDKESASDLEEKLNKVGEKINKSHKMLVPVEKIVSSQSLDMETFYELNNWQLDKLGTWQLK